MGSMGTWQPPGVKSNSITLAQIARRAVESGSGRGRGSGTTGYPVEIYRSIAENIATEKCGCSDE